ncbi:MAG: TRAP transporter TatT component family protein [bacterium]
MKKLIVMACLFALASTGCGMKKLTTGVIGGISTDGMVAVEGEQDVEFARESMLPLIKTLEVLRFGNPKDSKILAILSKAYGSFAFGFVELEILSSKEGDPAHAKAIERAKLFYQRGRDYGIESLSSDSGMRNAMNAPFPAFEKAVNGLGRKRIDALFWTAFNWANWINLNRDDPTAVVAIPKIQVMIDRVIELDPNFYFGSAHAFKGVLACTRPAMLGGDMALAQQEFAVAMGADPNYLMTRVLYAQFYARQLNDPALFRRELADVKSADPASLPEQALSNKLAIMRAELLLKKEKELF